MHEDDYSVGRSLSAAEILENGFLGVLLQGGVEGRAEEGYGGGHGRGF